MHEELRALCARLLTKAPLSRFPRLQARLREEVEQLLQRERAATQSKLEELIRMEEAYIFTDDPAFLEQLAAAVKKLIHRVDAPLLRTILSSYYATITRSVTNAAPKAIMLHMIKATETSIYPVLFENLGRQPPDGLLDEPPEVDAKRRADVELLAKLRAAKRALESLA